MTDQLSCDRFLTPCYVAMVESVGSRTQYSMWSYSDVFRNEILAREYNNRGPHFLYGLGLPNSERCSIVGDDSDTNYCYLADFRTSVF